MLRACSLRARSRDLLGVKDDGDGRDACECGYEHDDECARYLMDCSRDHVDGVLL